MNTSTKLLNICFLTILSVSLSACGGKSAPTKPDSDPIVDPNETVPDEMAIEVEKVDLFRGIWLLKLQSTDSFESGSLLVYPATPGVSVIKGQDVLSANGNVHCLISYRGKVINTLELLDAGELAERQKESPTFKSRFRVKFETSHSLSDVAACKDSAAMSTAEFEKGIGAEKSVFVSIDENGKVYQLELEGKIYGK